MLTYFLLGYRCESRVTVFATWRLCVSIVNIASRLAWDLLKSGTLERLEHDDVHMMGGIGVEDPM